MSSILNALKKLENQTSQQQQDQPWPQVDTKEAIRKRARGTWLFHRLAVFILILGVLIGLGAGGWFLMGRRLSLEAPDPVAEKAHPASTVIAKTKKEPVTPERSSVPDISQKKREQRSQTTGKGQESQKTLGSDAPEKESSSKTRASSLTKNVRDTSEDVRKRAKPVMSIAEKKPSAPRKSREIRKPPASVKTGSAMPGPSLAEEKPPEPSRISNVPKPPPAPFEKIKEEPERPVLTEKMAAELDMLQDAIDEMRDVADMEKAAQLELLEKEIRTLRDREIAKPSPQETRRSPAPSPERRPKRVSNSKFKVQALVWSDDPKRRFAVINNRVVRTGGSVDGALLTHIGNDHVILKKGGEEWELKFQLK